MLVLYAFRWFIEQVRVAGGRFRHVPTGNARKEVAPSDDGYVRDGPEVLSAMGALWAIPTVECPDIAYRQGAADFCAAYGLASAVHHYGDRAAASVLAGCAPAALKSNDAFGWMRNVTNDLLAGWSVAPMTEHDPVTNIVPVPVNLQLVGTDGAGTHAVATLGDLIFDSAEACALPLSRANLDRCVGARLNGARFSHVARAVRLVPGKSVRKRVRCDP